MTGTASQLVPSLNAQVETTAHSHQAWNGAVPLQIGIGWALGADIRQWIVLASAWLESEIIQVQSARNAGSGTEAIRFLVINFVRARAHPEGDVR